MSVISRSGRARKRRDRIAEASQLRSICDCTWRAEPDQLTVACLDGWSPGLADSISRMFPARKVHRREPQLVPRRNAALALCLAATLPSPMAHEELPELQRQRCGGFPGPLYAPRADGAVPQTRCCGAAGPCSQRHYATGLLLSHCRPLEPKCPRGSR